jgi:hypothetical protein
MIKSEPDKDGADVIDIGSNRLQSEILARSAPRIHSPLNDLPSKGFELIDFADRFIEGGFMPWQKWLAEHSLKVKPDGRWQHPISVAMLPRQQGKSTYMLALIAMGLFDWNEKLQISSAHRLVTSLEQFRQIVSMIEAQMMIWQSKSNASDGSTEPKRLRLCMALDSYDQGRRLSCSRCLSYKGAS